MKSQGNIAQGLSSGGDLFVEGGAGTKISSEYFAGIGTDFCGVRDNWNQDDKNLFVTFFNKKKVRLLKKPKTSSEVSTKIFSTRSDKF